MLPSRSFDERSSAGMTTWHRNFAGSIPETVATARWIEQFAREQALPSDVTFALQLCVEELLTNIVRHGGTASPNIDLTLALFPDRVELALEDDGKPFDVSTFTPPPVGKPIEKTQLGGLGVRLIHSFANRLDYSRAGLGNRVVAVFNLPEPARARLEPP